MSRYSHNSSGKLCKKTGKTQKGAHLKEILKKNQENQKKIIQLSPRQPQAQEPYNVIQQPSAVHYQEPTHHQQIQAFANNPIQIDSSTLYNFRPSLQDSVFFEQASNEIIAPIIIRTLADIRCLSGLYNFEKEIQQYGYELYNLNQLSEQYLLRDKANSGLQMVCTGLLEESQNKLMRLVQLQNRQNQLFEQVNKLESCYSKIDNKNQVNKIFERYQQIIGFYRNDFRSSSVAMRLNNIEKMITQAQQNLSTICHQIPSTQYRQY